MAKDAPKTTVSITPGQNEPVDNVLKFEDLVAQARQGAAKTTRSRASAKGRDQLAAVQRLTADLEKTLRALRAASPDKPAPSRASRTPSPAGRTPSRARKRKA